MGSFRASSSANRHILHSPYAGPVTSNDRARRRVRFASGVAQFEIPGRFSNLHGSENAPVVPEFGPSCNGNADAGCVPSLQRTPLGVRDQNILAGSPSSRSRAHGSPAFSLSPSPSLLPDNAPSSPHPPSCFSPLPFLVPRRGPSSPEELQSSIHTGHYVGPPLQGPRVPIPDLPTPPQHILQQPQATASPPRATPSRLRTSSTLAPVHTPIAACAASRPQRSSSPQYDPCAESHVSGDMVHYLLKGDSLLSWDIRQEPQAARIASNGGLLLSDPYGNSYRPDLCEKAVCRGLIQVEIDLSNLRLAKLQQLWGPIVVRSIPSTGVKMKDLLTAIYCYFHQELTRKELREISSDLDLMQKIKAQYADRYYLNDLSGVDAFRRSDILEGLTQFRVLDVDSIQGEKCFATLRLKS